MRIIQPGKKSSSTPSPEPGEVVPFIPAYDLLELQERKLTDEEIRAIGLALHLLAGSYETRPAAWTQNARVEAVHQSYQE